MFLYLVAGIGLLGFASTGTHSKFGYLEASGDDFLETPDVTENCKVLDLEGYTGGYEIEYDRFPATSVGCALLYKGGNCVGTPTKSIKVGDTEKLAESDGYYWGVQYAETC